MSVCVSVCAHLTIINLLANEFILSSLSLSLSLSTLTGVPCVRYEGYRSRAVRLSLQAVRDY